MATREPKIHPFKRRGNTIGFVVDCGKQPTGKRLKRFFKELADAQAFQNAHRQEAVPSTSIIFDRRTEVLRCFEKLKEVNEISLEKAVDFYLLHGALKGTQDLDTVIDELIREKRTMQLKDSYVSSLSDQFSKFTKFIPGTTKIADITTDQIFKYVYVENSETSAVTKNGYLRNLSVLFRFAIAKRYLRLNPLVGVKPAKEPTKKPALMSPKDMQTLLNRCLKNRWHDRLVIFVLIGFCGVRRAEACQLKWSDIDLKKKVVTVSHEVAKDWAHRENKISKNAMKWLLAVEDKRRSGLIIGANGMSLLRSAVRFAKIDFSKNCLRHSYASYALKAGWGRDEVAMSMGHDDLTVLGKHYRDLPDDNVTKAWWKIVPPPTS